MRSVASVELPNTRSLGILPVLIMAQGSPSPRAFPVHTKTSHVTLILSLSISIFHSTHHDLTEFLSALHLHHKHRRVGLGLSSSLLEAQRLSPRRCRQMFAELMGTPWAQQGLSAPHLSSTKPPIF